MYIFEIISKFCKFWRQFWIVKITNFLLLPRNLDLYLRWPVYVPHKLYPLIGFSRNWVCGIFLSKILHIWLKKNQIFCFYQKILFKSLILNLRRPVSHTYCILNTGKQALSEALFRQILFCVFLSRISQVLTCSFGSSKFSAVSTIFRPLSQETCLCLTNTVSCNIKKTDYMSEDLFCNFKWNA